eukprot:g2439.t1
MAKCYCNTLAVEAAHLSTQEQVEWIAQRMENRKTLSSSTKRHILKSLIQADQFERFLAQKFPATKRFGLEGCEAVLLGMKQVIEQCGIYGVRRVEIGIAHRGRLNVLCNLLEKPFGALCNELSGSKSDFEVGDVLYHLGQSGSLQIPMINDQISKSVDMFVAPNPSHLEFINPVILGMVRAEQKLRNDQDGRRVMGLLVHGDAAFSGLGIVAETLQLSDVEGFRTGGVIHFIINNQIGFTTIPAHGRSGLHATDVVKMIGAPVFHVNADDPEAVFEACQIAADWRHTFQCDVVIDVVGYRRHGHNERDNPESFLPLTYERVKQHPPVLELYSKRLLTEGVISHHDLNQWIQQKHADYEQEWTAFQDGKYKESAQQFLSSNWQGEAIQALCNGDERLELFHQEPTGLPLKTLQFVGEHISRIPESFRVHSDFAGLYETRKKMLETPDSRVNWSLAEGLALGTLALHRGLKLDPEIQQESSDARLGLNKGHYHVRLTGQDVERGTFNHRNAVLYDQKTGQRYVKLNEISPGKQQSVEVWNSPLSEAAVLGFEYGFSLGARNQALVLWESQFGDFANNAQVFIDQFLSSGEEKWGQQSGIVLLLPHGYDGEGPDHSSARLERFLSLCNDDPDHLPGYSPDVRKQIGHTFKAISEDSNRRLNRTRVAEILKSIGVTNGGGELLDLLWSEMGVSENSEITQTDWEAFMVQYIRRNAERRANLFVVNATTPAQMFHALRRQCNLPYKKPLVMMSPKFLLHHTPCTSALSDFTTGTFFNRVIEDGKISDNTRHLSVDKKTGESFLMPPDQIQRVILCSGQIYYHLANARRSRKVRNVVLVRLEQISPFPHDLLTKIVSQYSNAEIAWCQEEPKNMGAWLYVRPRMQTAMRELCWRNQKEHRELKYIGRPVSASTATASFKIHRQESKEIIHAAFNL